MAPKWSLPDETFVDPSNAKHADIHATALAAFVEVAELFEAPGWQTKDGKEWKLDSSNKQTGDTVYTRQMHKNKAFAITGELQATLDDMERLTWSQLQETPDWCKQMLEYRRIIDIGSHTDVVYGVSAPAGGGLISSRDMVTARVMRKSDEYFMQGGQSVEFDELPEQKGKVRAHDNPFLMRCTVIPDKPGYLKIDFLTNTMLKGWLPSKVVNQFFSESLFNYLAQMRDKIQQSS